MNEIAPGLFHWSTPHPNIGMLVSSYRHAASATLLDPLLADDDVSPLDRDGLRPERIVLTNRHHVRSVPALVDAFGCTVHASAEGLHDLEGRGFQVEPFAPGDVLAGGLEVHEVGVICPDEVAVLLPDAEALACADGVVRWEPQDPLGFVPDYLLGDDPEAIKDGLRAAYARLAELDFRHLLLAHGDPIVGEGRARLAAFAA